MAVESEVKEALYDVIDPELNMNIVDLGLVYRAQVAEGNIAEVDFTLTSPLCPLADLIAADIVDKVKRLTDAAEVRVNVVWNPPWNENMMSENARLLMGFPI